jgi:hypothetical protein
MVGRWVKHFQLGAVCSGGPFPFRRMKMVVSSVSIVEASKPSNIAATTMQGGYEFPAQPLHNFLSCGAGVTRLKPNQQVARYPMGNDCLYGKAALTTSGRLPKHRLVANLLFQYREPQASTHSRL